MYSTAHNENLGTGPLYAQDIILKPYFLILIIIKNIFRTCPALCNDTVYISFTPLPLPPIKRQINKKKN